MIPSDIFQTLTQISNSEPTIAISQIIYGLITSSIFLIITKKIQSSIGIHPKLGEIRSKLFSVREKLIYLHFKTSENTDCQICLEDIFKRTSKELGNTMFKIHRYNDQQQIFVGNHNLYTYYKIREGIDNIENISLNKIDELIEDVEYLIRILDQMDSK